MIVWHKYVIFVKILNILIIEYKIYKISVINVVIIIKKVMNNI